MKKEPIAVGSLKKNNPRARWGYSSHIFNFNLILTADKLKKRGGIPKWTTT